MMTIIIQQVVVVRQPNAAARQVTTHTCLSVATALLNQEPTARRATAVENTCTHPNSPFAAVIMSSGRWDRWSGRLKVRC